MNARWLGAIVSTFAALGTGVGLAQSERTPHFAESFLISIGGCSRLINNIPVTLRTQRSGKPNISEFQSPDAMLMGRQVRDWTDSDVAVATQIGVQCFGGQSGVAFGEAVKQYVSGFQTYDQRIIEHKAARKRIEREVAERAEREEAEQLRQQIETDKEKSRVASEKSERLAPLIAEAQKSAEARRVAETTQQKTEESEFRLRSNTPEYKLRSAYRSYAMLLRCKQVRDGYAAVNLSDAEMSSAKTAIQNMERVLEDHLRQASTKRMTKDELWQQAAEEAQSETQNWDSRSNLTDICRQMLASLLAGERQLSGNRMLQKDF